MAATKEVHIRRMPVALWHAVAQVALKRKITIYEFVVSALSKAVTQALKEEDQA